MFGLVERLTRASVRSSPFLSGAQANPAGLAAGSRWSFRGRGRNDHRTREPKAICIPEGCQNRASAGKTSLFPRKTKDRLATVLAPVLGAGPRTFTRWSAPFVLADHRLPAANPDWLVSGNEIGTQPRRRDLSSLMQPFRVGLRLRGDATGCLRCHQAYRGCSPL
jgi:hypothetical protein